MAVVSTLGTIALDKVKAKAPGVISTTYTTIRAQAQEMSDAQIKSTPLEEAVTPTDEAPAPKRITAELDLLNELKAERETAAKEAAEYRTKAKEALEKAELEC